MTRRNRDRDAPAAFPVSIATTMSTDKRSGKEGALFVGAERKPRWLRVDRLLGEHGLPGDTQPARREFALWMEARRAAELANEWKAVRRGWCLGGKEFRQELLEAMRGRTGPHHGGEERRETEEAWAGQRMADELRRRR